MFQVFRKGGESNKNEYYIQIAQTTFNTGGILAAKESRIIGSGDLLELAFVYSQKLVIG